MDKKLKACIEYIEKEYDHKNKKASDDLIAYHLQMVQHFQHERLVHLIVTVFVGSMTILFLLFGLLTNNIYLYILFASTFILFIPYIFYYYFLENGVQKLYKQYWLLLDKEKK